MTSTTTISRPRPCPPLAGHVYSYTTDPVQAAAEGSDAMSPHRLRADRAGIFSSRMHAVRIGSSTLVYLAYGGAVDLEAVAPMDYFVVQMVLQGRLAVATEFGQGDAGPGTGCVVSPGNRLRMRFAPGTAQIAVKIPEEVVERALGRLGVVRESCRPPVFTVPAPRNAPLLSALQLAVSTVDQCASGAPHTRLGDELERMLVTALLVGQPHNATSRMLKGPRARSSGYRAAGAVAEALRAAPQDAVDLGSLARSAGVSLRTLQEGFNSRYGRSPSSYLRDLRLEQAHHMLRDHRASAEAGLSSGTVTDIALSCGFTHLGRFAQEYRQRYGCPPSATLARCAAPATPRLADSRVKRIAVTTISSEACRVSDDRRTR